MMCPVALMASTAVFAVISTDLTTPAPGLRAVTVTFRPTMTSLFDVKSFRPTVPAKPISLLLSSFAPLIALTAYMFRKLLKEAKSVASLTIFAACATTPVSFVTRFASAPAMELREPSALTKAEMFSEVVSPSAPMEENFVLIVL
ncbi:MAG: hypothetical protein BWY66_00280 [bacterium ADurb.Bin374]|nr:MAG: hypothetical protein BWY66_00280 [bacterium ADurb.Bin374]